MTAFAKYTPGQFCWIDLMSRDLDGSKSFYGSLFGWEGVDQDTQGGPPYVLFERDGRPLAGMALMPPEMVTAGMPPLWNSYVSVEDVAATLARVEGLGGMVTMPAMPVLDAGSMGGLQDPSGGFLFLWQPNRHHGAAVCNEPGSLCWNELATRDIDAARTFFGELFGWDYEAITGGPTRYYASQVGGRMNGGLLEMNEQWGEMPPCWSVYFAVDDTDATVAKVVELGGRVCQPAFDLPVGRMAVVADPQGAVFCVMKLNAPD